jgi:hypothetical protein
MMLIEKGDEDESNVTCIASEMLVVIAPSSPY